MEGATDPDPDAMSETDPGSDPTTSVPSSDPTTSADPAEPTTSVDPADPSLTPASAPTSPPTPPPPPATLRMANFPGLVRYRLLIHGNPVNQRGAFLCYGGCREALTEMTYLECLSQCPGFEVDAGLRCGPDEGIPNSVCIERRPSGPRNEPPTGAVIAAVILNVALMFSLASLCNASASGCGLGYRYVPY